MKPITVAQLKKFCEEEIKKGNADCSIMLSDDDEGNGYHYMWFGFTEHTDFSQIFMDESVAPKKKTLLLC